MSPAAGRMSRALATVVGGAACVLLAAAPARAQLTLPTDFADDLILSGLNQPVGMAFLPDGRLLFVERTSANIRLVVNGVIAATDPVITVPNVRSTGNEQGLLGIVVDPGWPARPYIYIHYDYNLSANIRLSRYTVAGDLGFTGNGSLTINPATRYDILTDIPDVASNHNGGTLRFGPDGMLYQSIGDDATSCQAQSLTVLAGKILRLNVAGLPAGGGGPPAKSLITPATNPYVANPNANAKLVGYWGLRNPFRFAIDPTNGSLVIGDVGQNLIEEMDYVTVTGRNLQWPIYEGDIPGPTTCAGVDSTNFTDPIYTYDHSQGLAVNGGLLYRRPASGSGRFPPEYDGDILFCDFYDPWVRRLKKNGNAWNLAPAPGQPNGSDWAANGVGISDLLEAPDGSVWYCRMVTGVTMSGPGQLRRLRYTGVSSVPPPTPSPLEFGAPYPSPSDGNVAFDYVLPANAKVSLAIYDLGGRRVRLVVGSQAQAAGPHREGWDGYDDQGRIAPAGIYVARLSAAGEDRERRFSLVR
jgi:glucose/arabinose dehydrogenase